jgi:hypothetical protein
MATSRGVQWPDGVAQPPIWQAANDGEAKASSAAVKNIVRILVSYGSAVNARLVAVPVLASTTQDVRHVPKTVPLWSGTEGRHAVL